MRNILKSTTAIAAAAMVCGTAYGADFNIPAGDLSSVLAAYTKQTGVTMFYAADEMQGKRSHGIVGNIPADEALSRILSGTGFGIRHEGGGVEIIRDPSQSSALEVAPIQIAQAAPPHASVETVTVTSSKLGGADVQSIPIAITALSQEQLTSTQTAGGPDLVKNVPNLTFTKTNFTGYSIQIRGIGTQAISVTTDPAVAVAFNDIPFIRNHFFEQEFYDVGQVEVVRGPQGTLYGRNATAGVVNVLSAKPTDHWEATASVDVGNYNNRRLEGMINIPIYDDKIDLRVASEWTKRDGYSFNETTNKSIDGRDLWSSRVTIGLKPIDRLQVYGVWEHFQEDDDRLRTAKQLCKKDVGPTSVDGFDIANAQDPSFAGDAVAFTRAWLSQGCLPTSLYSSDAFETPNGQSIPFVAALEFFFNAAGGTNAGYILKPIDPYASQTQSRNLHNIQSELMPSYRAKNDTFELNANFSLTPQIEIVSQTGYNKDFLYSTEDFNRFNTAPGLFDDDPGDYSTFGYAPSVAPNGVYCDPQLGCSTKMVGEDLSQEHAWQFSQELRVSSNFTGPINFNLGANYMHYRTIEDYYVFFNLVTATTQLMNKSEAGDYTHCYSGKPGTPGAQTFILQPNPFLLDLFGDGSVLSGVPSNYNCVQFPDVGTYIDPNPITSLDGNGHNYFRSENPYTLNSWAGFGEVYYQVTPELKLTGGLRWTDDRKRFWTIPSWVFLLGGGYPVEGIVDQEWKEWTGRFVANWSPKLDFTDETLIYASYSRGYKGGGANPPATQLDALSPQTLATHPPTFDPEFVNAYELGTKNTLLDGSLTLNGDVFYYDYKGYQISQIVDRTSINLNVDAKIKGAEIEAAWEPIPGLRFNLAGGLEDSSINNGQSAVDLIDRTAGRSDWMVVKPFLTDTSNCILPASVIKQLLESQQVHELFFVCDDAYASNIFSGQVNGSDLTQFGVSGFDHTQAPNGGAGFAKDLGGNKLPNTPPFTLSFGAQYSMPISADWAGTLRGDFYWQGNSFARIFNDKPYDQLHGYTNVNLALIFTNQDGWQAMLYAKNVFDTTAITGAFLNSDDTALTTNVFLTDPRLFGIRITKNW